jgi:hypothetical protein
VRLFGFLEFVLMMFTFAMLLQDAADVRNLSLVYTLAGGSLFD